MTFVNLTPHTINEINSGKAFSPSGDVARVSSEKKEIKKVGGIPLFEVEFGEVQGLPEPQPDTIYIVSGMVLSAASDREDLVAPGDLVRNEEGQPIGCNGFRVN